MTYRRLSRLACSVALIGLLAACAGPLTHSSLQRPKVEFKASAMDKAIACQTQTLWDQPRPPLDRQALQKIVIRVARIHDVSGKTSPSTPSDNPRALQTYVQETISQTGLFELRSIDREDLPMKSPFGISTDYPSDFLIQGKLDGDSELNSQGAEAQISIGPFQFFASGRQRHITQRLLLEIADSRSGSVIKRLVDDPFAGVTRRMHMVVTVDVHLPETSFGLGGSYQDPSGEGITGGGDVTANINRPAALELAVKAAWFELVRRLSNSYEASEACLTEIDGDYLAFNRQLNGVVVDRTELARENAAAAEHERRLAAQMLAQQRAAEQEQAKKELAAAPAQPRNAQEPITGSAEPKRIAKRRPRQPTPPIETAPEPRRPLPAKSLVLHNLPGSGHAHSRDGQRWLVSNTVITEAGGHETQRQNLLARLPMPLRQTFADRAGTALFNALNQTLERFPEAGQSVTVELGKLRFRIDTGVLTHVQRANGQTSLCRNFHLAVEHTGHGQTLPACRTHGMPIWFLDLPTDTHSQGDDDASLAALQS